MNKNSGLIGLKIIRKQKNLNQLKVAMDLNISREVISYYENGKRNPDIEMLRTLSTQSVPAAPQKHHKG